MKSWISRLIKKGAGNSEKLLKKGKDIAMISAGTGPNY
jgi:hypothetical protein